MGFFPVDEQTCRYLGANRPPGTCRSRRRRHISVRRAASGAPMPGEVDYTTVLDLDLASVEPNLAGAETAAGPRATVRTA
ncbi:MAG: hypothetical protein WDN48_10190 [Pseudolabrys sp.]